MNYSLHISAAPYSNQGAMTALKFAQALILKGHTLNRVFFSGEGVLHGNLLSCPPQDEINLTLAWSTLAEKSNCELILCISSALRYGVINEGEAKRHDKPTANLQGSFVLSGLGQLVEACLIDERVLHFK